MPVSDAAARALAFLASEIRAETIGAGEWDAHGTISNLDPIRNWTLAEVMRSVSRLAEDPKAKTPGGLRDSRNPCHRERSEQRPTPRNVNVRERCNICGQGRDAQIHIDDHKFERHRRGRTAPEHDEIQRAYDEGRAARGVKP